MLFNSYVFVLAFFPVVLIGYFGLNHCKKYFAAKVFLVLCSLFFYGYYNWWYLFIICLSVLFNYEFSQILLKYNKARVRKIVFAISLFLNLGSLFVFKYYDFFISNINTVFQSSIPFLHLALPLGISFFTFQQLSYIIDSYKGDRNIRQYSFWDYALFVTYFPQLIAGPIVTHDEMVPQFADLRKKKFDYDNFAAGLYGFALGLAKKVLLADTFGVIVDSGFSDISNLGCYNAVFVMLAYTFQIYFDFSGYCDMATGIGKMMNIDITMNFDSPYKAIGIVDFWKRWHITLTRFFTRYIYIPLGGNRKGESRTYLNILIVFLISGIWHGANWTFILWGILHGIANVITRLLSKKTRLFTYSSPRVVKALLWLATFLFVNITWVIFRADSIGQAFDFLKQLFVVNGASINYELFNGALEDLVKIANSVLPSLNGLINYSFILLFAFAFFVSVFVKNANRRMCSFKASYKSLLFNSCLNSFLCYVVLRSYFFLVLEFLGEL